MDQDSLSVVGEKCRVSCFSSRLRFSWFVDSSSAVRLPDKALLSQYYNVMWQQGLSSSLNFYAGHYGSVTACETGPIKQHEFLCRTLWSCHSLWNWPYQAAWISMQDIMELSKPVKLALSSSLNFVRAGYYRIVTHCELALSSSLNFHARHNRTVTACEIGPINACITTQATTWRNTDIVSQPHPVA